MKKKRHFTLFFLPPTGKKVKKVHLSRTKVTLFFALFLVVSFFLLYGVVDYISLKHRSFENLLLRTENNNLHRQLDEFQSKMGKVEETLHRLNTFATKLRIITKLEDPDRLHRLAIGPLTKRDYDSIVPNRDIANMYEVMPGQSDFNEENSSLTQIDQKLRLLQHAASLQEQNLGQLQELLEDQRSLLRSLPSIRPTDGWVTSGFGARISPFTGLKTFHDGLDIANRTGTIITAPADGLVTFSGVKPGYGNTLVIDHGYGIVTKYGHNSVHFVKPGDKIVRGQRIATVGNTGRSTGPHCHYEVQVNGIPRNPNDYILDE
jgi:murein DD-endopeptidase MepM/ murein hydrolase activator NlpD